MEQKNSLRGALALLCATLIWGTSFVVMKDTLDTVPTFYLLGIRFTIGAVLLALFSVKKLKTINRQYLKYGALMGVFLIAAYTTQTFGLTMTTPGKNAFLTAVYCIMVPFMYWVLKKKRPDGYTMTAAVLCIVGIGCISLGSDLSINMGDVLTLAGGFLYACHMMTVASAAKCGDMTLLTMLQFAVAAVVAWLGALIFEKPPTAFTTGSIMSLAYLGVMATTVSLLLQSIGQKYTHPSSAAVILSLESVFGAAISLLVGQDTVSLKLIIGFVLVFLSVILSETKLEFLRKKQSPQTKKIQ